MKIGRRKYRKLVKAKENRPDILNPEFEPRGDEDDGDEHYWIPEPVIYEFEQGHSYTDEDHDL